MEFDVFGPFNLRRHTKKKILTSESAAEFKDQLEAQEPGLLEACGCYVFAIQAGRGYTPWYVGQAAASSLSKEPVSARNINLYNTAIADQARTPVIFIVPMRTPGGKFRKRKKDGPKLAEIDELEKWLITDSYKKNGRLLNRNKTKHLQKLHVVGVYNATHGEATRASRELKRAIS